MKAFGSLGVAAAALALMAATPAAADVVIVVGNSPQSDENVLLGEENGNLVVGATNVTGFLVNILGNEPLDSPSEGQARVATPAPDTGLTFLDFTLDDPSYGFKSLIVNLFSDGTSGSVTFSATDQFNELFQGTFAFGNGQNFFTLVAINGQLLTDVSFTTTVEVLDVRQIRLGGVELIDTPVPEPGTWALMILGFGGVGAMLRRRQAAVFAG